MERHLVAAINRRVRMTRRQLLPKYGKTEEIGRKGDNPHSVVTQLDHDVEDYLRGQLRSLTPDIGFVGEEKGGDRSKESFWLCDPIDGTLHFLRGMPYCTVMLALIEQHQVVFSVIYDFVHDHLYHAIRGGGAFMDDRRIKVSTRPDEDAYIFFELQHDKGRNREIFTLLCDNYPMMDTMSAGHEYIQVATGKMEARVNVTPWGKDWDYAPGSLLVSEAGGIVANIGTRTYDYRNLDSIAATPAVFAMLTEGEDAIFPTK